MKYFSLFLLTNIFLLSFSCTKKATENNTSKLHEYDEYIEQISYGSVSVFEPISIVLKNPVGGWDTNQELDANILKISPKIKGKLIAKNNRTLVFEPENPLESDKKYTFNVKLSKLGIDVKKPLSDTFSFSIKTLKQQFSISTNTLQSYGKNWQYIDGNIVTNDFMSLANAKQLLNATQKQKALKIEFSSAVEKGKNFSFRIDSIQRFEDDSTINLKWNGKKFGIETKGDEIINISGKNNFSVLGIEVDNSEGQHIKIQFSDPLKQNQNFEGLVTIQNTKDLKFSTQGHLLNVYPNTELKGTLKLSVFEGIQSIDNYKLKKEYSENVVFEQPKPEVKLISSGVILPTSNNLKFNFETINLKSVDLVVYKIFKNNILQFLQYNEINGNGNLRQVGRPIAKKRIDLTNNTSFNPKKWNAFAIDLQKIINPDPGAIYRIEIKYKKAYSLYECNEGTNTKETEIVADEENFDQEISDEELWEEDYYYNDYNWSERKNPCSNSFYRNKKVAANILASNIGVIVKKGKNETINVIVNDIITTQPINGATVKFYNYQQQEIVSLQTDADGMANFTSKQTAFFAIAAFGNQKTYIKLNDGNSLSTSKFDVAGVRLKKGIKGFIYGERGVWRPGDTIHLSFMLNDNANKLPKDHPVILEIRDPYGKINHKEIETENIGKLYHFSFATQNESPTGNWSAKVKVGGAEFYKTLKVETIKPNRLKVKTTFEKEILQTSEKITGTLEAKWLHGAIAKNLKADVTARLSPTKTTFKNYKLFCFDDPSRRFRSEDFEVFNGTLSSTGKIDFNVKPNLNSQAPGMLKASFISKVYENGGDFSTNVTSKTLSPYQTYVGIKAPEGNKYNGSLLTDRQHNFNIVTLNESGKPKAIKNLEVYVYKINWRWWWDTSEENLSSFNRSSYKKEVFKTKISTNSAGKANFNFSVKYPEWGRYLVRVIDPQSKHATGKTIYIDWPGWSGKSSKNDPSAATMLLFSSDKKQYNTGESALITFPSAENGRALVSIENGSKILSAFWLTVEKGETKFELPILKEYAPNIYVNITLLQPHASTKNDLPIRLYGVIPLKVENPETILNPKIEMPNVLEPESTINVQVSEEKGIPMTYSIAIVDEGLLDLTNYKTPNPHTSFFARESLGVKTWDIYDDVIGAYGGDINQIFSIGGDADAAAGKSKKANRFPPMVVYKGPFQLQKGASKTHQIKIPKYIGSVRTMVVASNIEKEAYGNTEKATPVRKPLMVLSSLPRKITPGEKVTVPVTVFAMEPKVKNVSVSLIQNKGFKVIGEAKKQLSFSKPDEKMVFFEIEVLDETKITDIKIKASGNGETADYNIPIDIVNPNPITTEVTSITLEPNSEKTISMASFGVKGSNNATIEFSSLPPINFEGRLQYLIRYPHGCVEQTTSSAFPQLFLNDIFDLTQKRKTKVQNNVTSAIDRLKLFIQTDGGFSYWPGYSNSNDWGSSYAGHFLLEANKKGYMLPVGFKSNWINYQQNVVRNWRGDSDLNQAYRLYTLALAESPNIGAMNRLREKNNVSAEAKYRLAAAYALIGQQAAARKLIGNGTLKFTDQGKYNYYSYGSVTRNKAMALETLILLNEKEKAHRLAKEIADLLSSKKWMSTQTTAYALLAMSKYATFVGGKGLLLNYKHNAVSHNIETSKSLANTEQFDLDNENTFVFKNEKESTVFIQVSANGILPVGKEKEIKRNLNVIVDYKDKNGKIINVSNLQQGTNFIAEVSITNNSDKQLKDMALTEIFPSGWEIVNTRFTDFGNFKENKVTYTDIRDDRVNFYFDLASKKTLTTTILLNASYLGQYYLPGVQCEAMYDNNYLVRNKGKWVSVIK